MARTFPPAEIESFLTAHEDVLDVTVIGVQDEKWGGEAIAAVVVPRGEAGEGMRQRLIDYAAQGLSPYKVPPRLVSGGRATHHCLRQDPKVQAPCGDRRRHMHAVGLTRSRITHSSSSRGRYARSK